MWIVAEIRLMRGLAMSAEAPSREDGEHRRAELGPGEELSHQLRGGPAHDGVGVSDDEVVEPPACRIPARADDGLGAVTSVDLGP
jgi:hypothetical protein